MKHTLVHFAQAALLPVSPAAADARRVAPGALEARLDAFVARGMRCLVLAGAFALLLGNMEQVLARFGEELHVSAYLADGLNTAAQERLAERVQAVPGVESVRLVTKEVALERFRASPFGRASLLDGLDENPLPASLEIVLAPAERNRGGVEALVAALRGIQGIAELGYGYEWVEGYARAVGLVRGVALGIGAVLALATLLIVANTIRLSIYARRDELETSSWSARGAASWRCRSCWRACWRARTAAWSRSRRWRQAFVPRAPCWAAGWTRRSSRAPSAWPRKRAG